jgi:hypothetical protein
MRVRFSGSRWRLALAVVIATFATAVAVAYSQSWNGVYPTPGCHGCEAPDAQSMSYGVYETFQMTTRPPGPEPGSSEAPNSDETASGTSEDDTKADGTRSR